MSQGHRHLRRRFARVPLCSQVTEGDSLAPATGRAVDLCVWGLRYFGPSARPARQREVYLSFCLPDDRHPIHCLALVAGEYKDPPFCTTSVRFSQIADTDLARIRRFVADQRYARAA